MKKQILFMIDKEIREEKILDKRVLIIGSMFSILVWMATLNFIISSIGKKLHFFVFCMMALLVYLSVICYKQVKEDFMNLEYEVNRSKNQTQTKSEFHRLKINPRIKNKLKKAR